MYFTKIVSQMKKKGFPSTSQSKKIIYYQTAVALKTWGPSAFSIGVGSFVLMCYMTEWRALLQYVPYYNGKYRQLEAEDALERIKLEADDVERRKNALRDFKKERQDFADRMNIE